MPSVYSPRWVEPEETVTRHCEMPGCSCAGEYKAPKSRYSNEAKDYRWLCLEHVKKYNEQWNYFSGMTDPEMEDFWREAQTGHRPTWKRGSQEKYTRDNLNDTVYRTFADYLSGRETSNRTQRLVPIDRLTQTSLAVLNLEWPVTEQDVKSRYKTLVKQYHPDVNASETAEDYFKKVTEAYQQLKAAIKKLKDQG